MYELVCKAWQWALNSLVFGADIVVCGLLEFEWEPLINGLL